jgi:hypothetical protein
MIGSDMAHMRIYDLHGTAPRKIIIGGDNMQSTCFARNFDVPDLERRRWEINCKVMKRLMRLAERRRHRKYDSYVSSHYTISPSSVDLLSSTLPLGSPSRSSSGAYPSLNPVATLASLILPIVNEKLWH